VSQFVLDSTTTISWFVKDASNAKSFDYLMVNDAIVPSTWHIEVAHSLMLAEQCKRITKLQRQNVLSALDELPITVDSYTAKHAWHAIVDLVELYKVSVFDACYLELCLRRSLPLMSKSNSLNEASCLAKIEILE
jgi:predicted nucleic acid-binding protein